MAVYAVGDIQGCYDQLRTALDLVRFNPDSDQLWLVGDLVNRGPKSLEVLRFVKELGDAAVSVLGNHDLHLLALASGNTSKAGKDTLDAILQADDRDELLHWLRHRPLMHQDQKLGFVMIHAGLPPQWHIDTAAKLALEVEQVLRSDQHTEFFAEMYGNKPKRWSEQLSGMDRLRFITNCFTRLRYCTHNGTLALKEKFAPDDQNNPDVIPWFTHPDRASASTQIVFGHWSTLGYHASNNVWALDTGCLWGGALTLLKLDHQPPQAIHFPCKAEQNPFQFA